MAWFFLGLLVVGLAMIVAGLALGGFFGAAEDRAEQPTP